MKEEQGIRAIDGLGWMIVGIVLMLLPLLVEPQSFVAALFTIFAGGLMQFRYMCIQDWLS